LEQIAVLTHNDGIYAIMHPVKAAEDEAVVFKISPEDEESVNIVDDEELADKILSIYHEQANITD
jgi:hypothetical protein